ncbi:MAG: Rab family GTPase [Thermoplasmatota archaeon]
MTKHGAKVVLLGDGAVGKTSLLRRYVYDKFEEDYIATIGVNVKKKEIDDLNIALSLWDIYGQKSVSPGRHASNYTGAEGAVVVFDLLRKKTFDTLNDWIKDLFEVTGRIPVVVLGNKNDMIENFEEEKGTVFTRASQKKFHDYMIDEHYYKSVYSSEPEFVPVPYLIFDKWAEKKNPFGKKFTHFLTSAKTGENVEKAFRIMAKMILNNKIKY